MGWSLVRIVYGICDPWGVLRWWREEHRYRILFNYYLNEKFIRGLAINHTVNDR